MFYQDKALFNYDEALFYRDKSLIQELLRIKIWKIPIMF